MAPLHPTEVEDLRSHVLRHYEVRAQHLNDMEKSLHSSMPRHVERVVRNKRILLFKEMLRDIDSDDQEVVSLLTSGVKVGGAALNAYASGQRQTTVRFAQWMTWSRSRKPPRPGLWDTQREAT